MNDSHVSVVSVQTVLSCQAYILFYSRVMPVAKPEETTPAKPAAVPSNGASTGPNADVGEIVAPLKPAVLVRTPAAAASATVTVPVVEMAGKARSDSMCSQLSQEEVEQLSSDAINGLFADKVHSDQEEDSEGSENGHNESRLNRSGGFKFYAPFRYVMCSPCYLFIPLSFLNYYRIYSCYVGGWELSGFLSGKPAR